MRPLRNRIHDAALKQKIPQLVIEKDYAISYILAGIASQSILNEILIFKGGTALKKLFFGDYRFSEDLDFSAKNDSLAGDKLEIVLQDVNSN
jgi:predicted nucleotidyltransferase component of viral defense system